MCWYVSQAITTAITPATEPTTLAIIVILLSLLLLLDEPLGDAIGEVDVEVGAGCSVLPVPPGVAKPGLCKLCLVLRREAQVPPAVGTTPAVVVAGAPAAPISTPHLLQKAVKKGCTDVELHSGSNSKSILISFWILPRR